MANDKFLQGVSHFTFELYAHFDVVYFKRLLMFHVLYFTARRRASAVYALLRRMSDCLSVTSRCSTETAKRRITQTAPHDSPCTLVF